MQNMNQAHHKNPNSDNNISKTGYRALFLLMKLLESPKTRDEILECFEKDIVIKSDLSKDTVTNTVNALKKAGCVISRPTQRTKNKYVLKSHPFSLCLSKENVEALLALRESIVTLCDWELLLHLNHLYAKISKLAPDNESRKRLLYEHPLKNINQKILKELLINASIKKHIVICYDSPEYGEEELYYTPEYVTFENRKLYIWGYNKKYEDFSYLRIDRIKKMNLMNFLGENPEAEDFEKPAIVARYKLKGLSAMMYIEETYEVIEEENPDEEYPLTIKAVVNNKFNFLQRILAYGPDCLLISPSEIKEELLVKLKNIKKEYKGDPTALV